MTNMRVIIFSKNRPMQLRAHLESMYFYTGFQDEIDIITPTPELYTDLLEDFPNLVFWNEETIGGFHLTLERVLKSIDDNDLVLLAVDDFIYTRYINLRNAFLLDGSALSKVIGFTLRMGINTEPYDISWNVSNFKPIVLYDWRNKPSHLGYPFDVSCSFYKASLINEIVSNSKRPMNIPNDLESIGVQYVYANKGDSHPFYMMTNDVSCGACADINRVQDLYQNRIQGGEELNPENMIKMYKEGRRINWFNYYRISPKEPFIGKEGLVIQ